jgi:hypothetical protein
MSVGDRDGSAIRGKRGGMVEHAIVERGRVQRSEARGTAMASHQNARSETSGALVVSNGGCHLVGRGSGRRCRGRGRGQQRLFRRAGGSRKRRSRGGETTWWAGRKLLFTGTFTDHGSPAASRSVPAGTVYPQAWPNKVYPVLKASSAWAKRKRKKQQHCKELRRRRSANVSRSAAKKPTREKGGRENVFFCGFHSEKALRDQLRLIPKSHHEKALENRSSGRRKLFVSKHFDGKPARSMHIKSPGMNPSGGLDLKPIRLQALIDLVHLLLT